MFENSEFENKIATKNNGISYTYSDIKKIIAENINDFKNKKNDVVILSGDNFKFIIQFFTSLYCGKNVYLITDKTRLNDLTIDYEVLGDVSLNKSENNLPEIDIMAPYVNFFTSGSSGKPKLIRKSLFNLMREAEDIGEQFDFYNKDFTVISTTTMCHLFGLTFHLMTALYNGLTIDTKEITYPENADLENSILVSTPTFLSTIPKFNFEFKIPPKYIISAGSKLNEDVFEYIEKNSNIIEIYGSTETGVMANKTHYNADFKLFDNVKLNCLEDKTEVISDYFYEDIISVNDKIELKDRTLKIKNRTDRLFKIYEKRVSADELEMKLKDNELVEKSYITKNAEKLVCLCVLSKDGKNYLLKNGINKITKNLKQHLSKYSEIVPQRWKFIDEIPMNTMGKTDKKLINKFFNVNLSLPVILDRKIEKDMVTYKLFFYNQCNFFSGHFPKFKIVPGVAQLFIAKEFANAHFNLEVGQGQWKRIKFSNIIEPDSVVNLRLEKTEKAVIYEYFDNTKKYSSGVFLCENIFKGFIK